MATYTTAEAALLTRVRAYNAGVTFTTANSSRGDFRVLNNDGVTQAAVLMQAGKSEFGDRLDSRGAHGKRQQRHRMAIVLFQTRGAIDDGTTYTTLGALTDALIAYLDTYPRLSNTAGVKRAEIVEASEPRIRRDSAWIFQTILVEVMTETAPVLVEMAS